jgi:hypothetical protein
VSASPERIPSSGRFVLVLGLLMIAAAGIVNGWSVRFFRGARAIDFRDVSWIFARWSLVLGLLTAGLGAWVLRSGSRGLSRAALSWSVLALALMVDRTLLVVLGRPLWIHDPVAHFRQRPGAVRLAAGNSGKLVRINRHGYHDEDFPLAKPPGELRGLVVGDSVTMGHMLTYPETYCELLEDELARRDTLHATHQIINAGVQGYAVFQELVALQDGLRFQPDFVALGFCMNDVTEPLVVQREFGGTGVDYHAVQEDASALIGYLRNESGIGRLLMYLEQRGSTVEQRKLWEDASVRGMVEELAADDAGDLPQPGSRYRAIWERTLTDLDRTKAVADALHIPFFLLVFPYSFQVYYPELRGPQRILARHADRSGIVMLDFTDLFRRALVTNEAALQREIASGTDPDVLLREHHAEWSRYYLDTNHFAPEGHRLVAAGFYDLLLRQGLCAAGPR